MPIDDDKGKESIFGSDGHRTAGPGRLQPGHRELLHRKRPDVVIKRGELLGVYPSPALHSSDLDSR
jgi:hypothetical protein